MPFGPGARKRRSEGLKEILKASNVAEWQKQPWTSLVELLSHLVKSGVQGR